MVSLESILVPPRLFQNFHAHWCYLQSASLLVPTGYTIMYLFNTLPQYQPSLIYLLPYIAVASYYNVFRLPLSFLEIYQKVHDLSFDQYLLSMEQH